MNSAMAFSDLRIAKRKKSSFDQLCYDRKYSFCILNFFNKIFNN